MTMERLLAEEAPVTILRQTNPGRVDVRGIPLHDLTELGGVEGGMRLVPNSTTQQAMWHSLGVKCGYTGIALVDTIQNGMFLYTADARLFRVVGVMKKHYAKGAIPTHYDYPLEEVRVL